MPPYQIIFLVLSFLFGVVILVFAITFIKRIAREEAEAEREEAERKQTPTTRETPEP